VRLCFIGNSHLAAFRTGWDKASSRYAGVGVDFFGAAGGDLESLSLRRREFVSEDRRVRRQLRATSGGARSISVDCYDGFLLVGLGLGGGIPKFVERYRTFSTCRPDARARHLVSDAVFDLMVRGHLTSALAIKLIRDIRSISDSPIVVAQTPRPRRGIMSHRKSSRAAADLLLPRLTAVWERSKAAIAAEHKIAIVDQPQETIEDNLFTKDTFGIGAIRLQEGFETPHKQNDYRHMNAAYGALYIDAVMPYFRDYRASKELSRAFSPYADAYPALTM
jgi:hypothetical protein